jgi:hypothetical protein
MMKTCVLCGTAFVSKRPHAQFCRRLVPFRRLMAVIKSWVEPDAHDGDGNLIYNGFFDIEQGADHQIATMLAYAGQTQQTPGGKITPNSVDEMMQVAASDYRPPEAVLDFAIDKKAPTTTDAEFPYQQAFKHAGVEIYASTAGYLQTAGGIQSPPAYTFELRGLSLGGSLLGIVPLSNNKDRGAAVPITLMLSAGTDRSSLEAFLQIAGPHHTLDKDNETYDDNLCVYRGFACGLNVRTPADMEPCFHRGPNGTPDQWRFFDSELCTPLKGVPRVMIARFLEDCHGDQTGECIDYVGLFEAVSSPNVDFPTFQSRVLRNNSASGSWLRLIGGLFGSNRTVLDGSYTTFFGEKIEFNTSGHQLDSSRTGITSVNGVTTPKLENWARAAGDVLNIDGGPGRYKFVNPKTNHGFSVDMSDWNTPKRGDF